MPEIIRTSRAKSFMGQKSTKSVQERREHDRFVDMGVPITSSFISHNLSLIAQIIKETWS